MRSSAAASEHVAVHETRDGGTKVKGDDLALFTIQTNDVTYNRGNYEMKIKCK
jgi:hypothetical protein